MQNFRALGPMLPDPQPPAAGGFAPRPPLASGRWEHRRSAPRPPKLPPIASFWLRAWSPRLIFSSQCMLPAAKKDVLSAN